MAFGVLEVLLVKAKGLQDSDIFGQMDPYVLIQYKGQEHRSNVAQDQGRNPMWNEKFTFKAEYPGSGDEYKLILKIMDKDIFTKDDFLGQTTIYVNDLLSLGVENGTAEIHPRKYSVIQADQSYRGEIVVGVSFTVKVEKDIDVEEVGGWKESRF